MGVSIFTKMCAIFIIVILEYFNVFAYTVICSGVDGAFVCRLIHVCV